MLLTAFSLTGCNASVGQVSEPAKLPQTLLSAPAQLDLGTLSPGGTAQQTFLLTNPTSSTVEIDDIIKSCDCLHIFPQTKFVGPGKQVQAVAQVDFSADPEFHGSLAIEVEGRTRSGQAAFKLMVKVTVR